MYDSGFGEGLHGSFSNMQGSITVEMICSVTKQSLHVLWGTKFVARFFLVLYGLVEV